MERGIAEDHYRGGSKLVDEAAAQVVLKLEPAQIEWNLNWIIKNILQNISKVNVSGKRILVVGTQTPWLEVVLLAR